MKLTDALILLGVIIVGATLANLIALKIASDQLQGSLNTSPLLGLFGKN